MPTPLINVLLGALLVLIVVAVVRYLVRCKKKGKGCVGCPYSECCTSQKRENGCDHSHKH